MTCLDPPFVGSLVLTQWMLADFGSLRDSCNLSFNFWLSSRAFGDVAPDGSGWWGGTYCVRFHVHQTTCVSSDTQNHKNHIQKSPNTKCTTTHDQNSRKRGGIYIACRLLRLVPTILLTGSPWSWIPRFSSEIWQVGWTISNEKVDDCLGLGLKVTHIPSEFLPMIIFQHVFGKLMMRSFIQLISAGFQRDNYLTVR